MTAVLEAAMSRACKSCDNPIKGRSNTARYCLECAPTEAFARCARCPRAVAKDGLPACNTHLEAELGVTYRMVDHWTRKGYLLPQRGARSSGVFRHWPPEEIEVIRRIARLTAAGLPPEKAAQFARNSWPKGEIAPGVVLEVTS